MFTSCKPGKNNLYLFFILATGDLQCLKKSSYFIDCGDGHTVL